MRTECELNESLMLVPAAGLLLRRAEPEGWRWLLLHSTKTDEWGFPKGHGDPGESSRATALRECAEESGIALVAITGPALQLCYALPNGSTKQVDYYPAITHQQRVQLSSEHHEHGWFNQSEVCERLQHANLIELFTAHCQELASP